MSRQPIQKRREPAFIEPMQCKSITALPPNGKWTFEIKFDGYRFIAVKRRSEVTLFSRNQKVPNNRFQKVVQALASLAGDFVLDGELVAFDPQGRPSFQILQNNLSQALPVYFYAFDLLNRDGESHTARADRTLPRIAGEDLFRKPKIHCGSRRSCKRHPAKFSRLCTSSVSKASWGSGSIPSMSPASDQAPGTSSARVRHRRLHPRSTRS